MKLIILLSVFSTMAFSASSYYSNLPKLKIVSSFPGEPEEIMEIKIKELEAKNQNILSKDCYPEFTEQGFPQYICEVYFN